MILDSSQKLYCVSFLLLNYFFVFCLWKFVDACHGIKLLCSLSSVMFFCSSLLLLIFTFDFLSKFVLALHSYYELLYQNSSYSLFSAPLFFAPSSSAFQFWLLILCIGLLQYLLLTLLFALESFTNYIAPIYLSILINIFSNILDFNTNSCHFVI